ncbi:unnamed protein product [Bemisia tabaci]|uniref:Uncharacterized protein n=1 Tax=Bemisia tabaci TaxID=7038 RepID=A0A9P0FZF6_BEMTA|nr:unnamed protein product [Bemisia tabaci]
MFAALKFRWVLVWICVIVFSSATQSTQGPAQFVTQPSIAIANLTHPQLKTKIDDYFLNSDDDSNNHDQDLQIRVAKTQKDKQSPAAKQTSRYLGFQGPNGKKSSRPTTPIPLYKTTNPGVDQLAKSLGVMNLQNPSQSATPSRGWGAIRRFKSSLRRSKKFTDLTSLLSFGNKAEITKPTSTIKRTSSMSSDSENEGGYSSG